MVEDKGHEYREIMQVVLLELKLKAIHLFKKFKQNKKNKVDY